MKYTNELDDVITSKILLSEGKTKGEIHQYPLLPMLTNATLEVSS